MTEPLKNAPRNWGPWGAEDQIGCLNVLTSDEVSARRAHRQQVKVMMPGAPVALPEAIRRIRFVRSRFVCAQGRLDDLLRAETNEARVQRCGHGFQKGAVERRRRSVERTSSDQMDPSSRRASGPDSDSTCACSSINVARSKQLLRSSAEIRKSSSLV